jgi:3' terminal RNA ribose 2'-O-methyltransferase Hen1
VLLKEQSLERIVGLDVSHRALETAARRLHLDSMAPRQRQRIELLHGSLTYRDGRLRGFDAAAVVEVVEHLDPPRLGAFERALFGYARPGTVIVTTPNAEYNVRFPTLPAGAMRHRDHRFEWTRSQFAEWAGEICASYGYDVRHLPVGAEDPRVGSATQMAIFTKAAAT